MTPDQTKRAQTNLHVAADGDFGPKSFTALFMRAGAKAGRAADMAPAAVQWLGEAGVTDTPLRLAHFMAQAAHESGGFVYMTEIWGPTDQQRIYEGAKRLGNIVPGDGSLYRGRGIFQLTGRANYRIFGKRIGLELEQHPEMAALPAVAVRIAAAYWQDRGLNALADLDDVQTITRRINGGLNGIVDRRIRLTMMKGALGV